MNEHGRVGNPAFEARAGPYHFRMDLGHGDRWRLDPCPACPAQSLSTGEFDVSDRPGPATRYDPTAGCRVNTMTGHPECVHPTRVRLPAGRYASNGEPPPAGTALQPPDDLVAIGDWFRDLMRQQR